MAIQIQKIQILDLSSFHNTDTDTVTAPQKLILS
jgi:hypothetical protein